MENNNIVLSLFGGGGLLDMGFERAGFCVVRGPDLLWGNDIKDFDARPLRGKINGVIAGVPCQKFSVCTKKENRKNHENLWPEFWRVIGETDPDWCLAECVYGAENAATDMYCVPKGRSYKIKRIIFSDLGSAQVRPRMILFSSKKKVAFFEQLEIKGKYYGHEWRGMIGRNLCICPDECNCENPDGEGVAHCSVECPEHNLLPEANPECPIHGEPESKYACVYGDRYEPPNNSKNHPKPPRKIIGDDFLDAFDLPKDWTIRNNTNAISVRTESKIVTQGVPVAAAYALAMTVKDVIFNS